MITIRGFITLTRLGYAAPDLRLNVAHIVAYFPTEKGNNAKVTTSEGDDDFWYAAESCDEIDQLINAAAGKGGEA